MIEKILFFFGWRQNWEVLYHINVTLKYKGLTLVENHTGHGLIPLALDSAMDDQWPDLIKHVIRQKIKTWPSWQPDDMYEIKIKLKADGWSRP